MIKINYAIFSGCSAAAASFFGKLCGLPISQEFILLKIIFFGLMLLSNAFVWTLFVKALQSSDSSFTATVTSAASNYVISALIGYFIFSETITVFWCSGMFFILVGLLLIIKDQPTTDKEKKNK